MRRSGQDNLHVYENTSEVDEQSNTKTRTGKKSRKSQTENTPENVYDNVGGDETEDVCNSTEVGTLQKEQGPDNVYYTITNDGSEDGTQYCELNFNS